MSGVLAPIIKQEQPSCQSVGSHRVQVIAGVGAGRAAVSPQSVHRVELSHFGEGLVRLLPRQRPQRLGAHIAERA